MNSRLLPSDRNEGIIGSATAIEDIITALARRGCSNLTFALDPEACGKDPIAGGGFCQVYQGKLHCGTLVAIKALQVYGTDGNRKKGKMLKHAAWELYHWSKLRHPNVLPLLGLTQFRGQLAMVSEWIHGGTLAEYLHRHPDADRLGLCTDVCAGLIYIHGQDMVHGDLKAANVMISSNNVAMISDFGCARLKELTLKFTNTTNHGFSIRWAAPELISDDNAGVSKASDVYAFGMTILEAITGSVPYDGVGNRRVLGLLLAGDLPSRPERVSDSLWGVLEWCWNWEPPQRPTVMDIMDCLYMLRGVDESHDAERIHAHGDAGPGPQTRLDRSSAPNHEPHRRRRASHSNTVYECPVTGCDYTTTDVSKIVEHTSDEHDRGKTYRIRTHPLDHTRPVDSSSVSSASSRSDGDTSSVSTRSASPAHEYETMDDSSTWSDASLTDTPPSPTSSSIASSYGNGRRDFDRPYRYSETTTHPSLRGDSLSNAPPSPTNSDLIASYEPHWAGRDEATIAPTYLRGSSDGILQESTSFYGYSGIPIPTSASWQDLHLAFAPPDPTISRATRAANSDGNGWDDSFTDIPHYEDVDLRREGSHRSRDSDRSYRYSEMAASTPTHPNWQASPPTTSLLPVDYDTTRAISVDRDRRANTHYTTAPSFSDSRHSRSRRGYETFH